MQDIRWVAFGFAPIFNPAGRPASPAAIMVLGLAPAAAYCGSAQRFGGGPEGRSEQNKVLDQELSSAAKNLQPMAQLQRPRGCEQETYRQQKRSDRAETSEKRSARRERPQNEKSGDEKLDDADDVRYALLAENQIHPGQKGAMGDERLDAVGFGRSEF